MRTRPRLLGMRSVTLGYLIFRAPGVLLLGPGSPGCFVNYVYCSSWALQSCLRDREEGSEIGYQLIVTGSNRRFSWLAMEYKL